MIFFRSKKIYIRTYHYKYSLKKIILVVDDFFPFYHTGNLTEISDPSFQFRDLQLKSRVKFGIKVLICKFLKYRCLAPDYPY